MVYHPPLDKSFPYAYAPCKGKAKYWKLLKINLVISAAWRSVCCLNKTFKKIILLATNSSTPAM